MQVHSSGFTLQFLYLVMFILKEHNMEVLEKIKKNCYKNDSRNFNTTFLELIIIEDTVS